MPRCLALLLIAVLIAGASGVLPAAAASSDCCGEPCAQERDRSEAHEQDDCESEAGGEEGGAGMGCPPLCTSCVCAAYFAPATLPASLDVPAAIVCAEQAAGAMARPASAPRTGVFHPPRPA